MIYEIRTGKPVVAQDKGLVVVDALHAYGDVSYIIVSAVGYAEDEQSVAEAKRLFELYKAAPEMLEALEEANKHTQLYEGHPGKYAELIAKAKGATA